MLAIDPPIVLEPRGGPRFEFSSIENFAVWITAEIKAWSRLPIPRQVPLAEWRNELLEPLQNLLTACHEALNKSTDNRLNQRLDYIRSIVGQYRTGPLIWSGSPDGQRVLSLIQKDPSDSALTEAAITVNHRDFTVRINNQADVSARLLFRSLLNSLLDETITAQRKEADLASIDQTVAILQERFDGMMGQAEAAMNKRTADLDEEGSRIASRISGLEQRRSSLWKAIQESIRSARAEQKALQQTYETLLSLKAPAFYWEMRSRKNRITARYAFGGFTTVFILFGFAVYYFWPTLTVALSPQNGVLPIGQLLLVAPLTIIAMWLLRMVARIFQTALTEAVDSDQREVMVRTFLALSKDPNTKISEAERLTILQALFRPAGGKTNDDNMPTNFWEAALKAAQGPKHS